MSIFERKAKPDKRKLDGDFLVCDDPFGEEYPGIFEVLCRVKYLGKDRRAGRLILYAELGRATLVLCDVDAGEVTFFAAETFGEALEGLERALQQGSCDWRQDKKSKYAK